MKGAGTGMEGKTIAQSQNRLLLTLNGYARKTVELIELRLNC